MKSMNSKNKESLLELAVKTPSRKYHTSMQRDNNEELELFLALIHQKITPKQAYVALGFTSPASIRNFVYKVLIREIRRGNIRVLRNKEIA